MGRQKKIMSGLYTQDTDYDDWELKIIVDECIPRTSHTPFVSMRARAQSTRRAWGSQSGNTASRLKRERGGGYHFFIKRKKGR